MRRWLLIGAGVLLAIVLMLGIALASIVAQFPSTQGERVAVEDGIVGVETGASYAWIVRTAHGVALVDSGMDPDAKALLGELEVQGLGPDAVHTILLTHAHRDHTGGLAVFPGARLIHGAGEGPLLRDQVPPDSIMPWIFSQLTPAPVVPAQVIEAADGQVLDVDGESVVVVHTPGHTSGSASYLFRDVLFSGDALVGNGTGVQLLPSFVADDYAQAARSVGSYSPLDFVSMADGHVGVTRDAKAKIQEFSP